MDLSSTKFKISLIDIDVDVNNNFEESFIDLNTYSKKNSLATGVYNEKLTEKENSQFSLTFNIEMFVNGTRNPLIDLIVLDRKLRLTLEQKVIDFYITSKTPTFGTSNVSYAITCQDAFSYTWSKEKVDINFSTEDEEIWDEIGPKTLIELTNKLLEISTFNKLWTIHKDMFMGIIKFPDNLYLGNKEKKVSIEISNSTPFNILTEIIKLFNAIIDIDYNDHTINFFNKDDLEYIGLQLKPEINLSAFSYSEKGDNLYNILTVTGGEDAYGNLVSIVPSMPQSVAGLIVEKTDEIELCIKNKTDTQTTIDVVLTYLLSQTNDDKIKEDVNSYFTSIQAIPHLASFLYDFSYWYKSGLLSQTRYNNIDTFLKTDLFFCNLILTAYSSIINPLQFSLNKKIDREEELCAAIGAEFEAMANYSDVVTSKFVYMSSSMSVDGLLYLQIGYIAQDDNELYIQHQKQNEKNSLPHPVPDFNSLIGKQSYYYTLDDASGNITMNKLEVLSTKNRFSSTYSVSSNDESLKGKGVYVLYDDVESYFEEQAGEDSSIDSLNQQSIEKNTNELWNLWNDSYKDTYYRLYGSSWLEDKIAELQARIDKYVELKNTYYNKMEEYKDYGDDMNKEVNFYDYKALYDDACIYIGGVGTRIKNIDNEEKYTFPGYLNIYLNSLKQLKSSITIPEGKKGLLSFLKNMKKNQRTLMNDFYYNYSDIIRETKYSDSNQLTPSGLYSSAYAQLLNYSQPTKSYSASCITNYDLEETATDIKIGDIIEVKHPFLKEKIKNNCIWIHLSSNVELFKQSMVDIIYSKSVGIESNPSYLNIVLHSKILKTDSNKILVEFDLENYSIDNIQCLYVNNSSKYSYYNDNHGFENDHNDRRIIAIEYFYEQEPIHLNITGITKDLRNNVIQLTVEENNIYKILVDRLVYYLQGK